LIRTKQVAVDLYISYLKQKDVVALKKFYNQFGDFNQLATLQILQSFSRASLKDRIEDLEDALASFKKAKEDFSAKSSDDEIRLLLLQKKLETELKQAFVGESLSDTLYRLYLLGQPKYAQQIVSEFKVPEKRLWWIRIRTFGEMKDWEGLLAFSREKKPPIGFKPFAEICLESAQIAEAMKYIPKIPEPSVRCELYLRIGNYTQAAEVAAKEMKDPQMLQMIRNKCTNPELQNQIDRMLQSFVAK